MFAHAQRPYILMGILYLRIDHIWDKTSNKAGIYGIIKKTFVNTTALSGRIVESNEYHFQYYLTLPSFKIMSTEACS